AEAAVLHHDGERDAWAFERREGDEKRMVAVALGDLGFLVLLVLLDGDDLRGAGLAAGGVGSAGEGALRSAFLVHAGHGALDELDVVAPQRAAVQDLGWHVDALERARIVAVRREARLGTGAV